MTTTTPPLLRFEGREIPIEAGETVLVACARAGVKISSLCQAGVCQSCLVRARSGEVPAAAQVGLSPAKKALGCLLACVCRPSSPLEIEAVEAGSELPATIVSVERLAPTIARVRLAPSDPRALHEMSFKAGQFVTLLRADGVARAYSIASLPEEPTIELHVRVVPGGAMSGWLGDPARVGERVRLRGPGGACFFTATASGPGETVEDVLGRPLVLAGVGTGLAPLWGIVRDALAQGQSGPILLVHGTRTPTDHYLREPLAALAAAHPNLEVVLCALEGETAPGLTIASIDAVVKAKVTAMPEKGRARAFVCGDPEMVARLKKGLFLAGLAMRSISGDAFVQTRGIGA